MKRMKRIRQDFFPQIKKMKKIGERRTDVFS